MIGMMAWLFLSGKRYLKRPAFLCLLLVFPCCAFLFRQEETKSQQGILVAVYSEDQQEDSLGFLLAQKLAAYREERGSDTLFSFYLCGDGEQVFHDVATGKAECGYVIRQGLKDRLDNRKYRGCIQRYEAPSTVAGSLASETLFSLLIEEYDRELFLDYVEKNEIFQFLEQPEGVQEAAGVYQEYRENGSTFQFEYQVEGKDSGGMAEGNEAKSGSGAEMNEVKSGRKDDLGETSGIFPVRGLASVFILITGLYGAVTLGRDEERGLFLRLHGISGWIYRGAGLLAPVLFASVSGLAAICLSGDMGFWVRELIGLFIYSVAVTAFSIILKRVTVKEQVFCCLIPFLVVGSLIFCPVFLDIGRWVPGAVQVGKLFLPYYYLKGVV